ncbi:MAG: PDZ domain-containing protein [Planctomyces sp.]|nr:PDZ domain-containing protein [Planctomyces sp.]
MARILTILIASGVATMIAGTLHAADIYVSSTGDDRNVGSESQPFASLSRAQQEARTYAQKESVTIWLEPGVYYLPQTFLLTSADSGSLQYPVTYRGKEPGVIISGGQRLALKWTPFRDGIYQASTPANLKIDQVFINGQRQHMARYPNFDPDVRPFNGFSAAAFSKERAATWSNPAGGFIHAMHRAHWGGYHYRITGKNAGGEIEYEGGWQNNRQMGMHNEHRFVENIFEELDAAGEWFHDSTDGILYYKPASDVDLMTALVEVVRLDRLIEFRGSQANPVQHITLQNLEFRHTARTFMENREPLLRSDWTIYRGGAVMFEGAEHCRIRDCVFNQAGGNAVFVNHYNRNIEITGCHIHDAGGNGICFVGSPATVRDPLFHYDQRQSVSAISKMPGPQSNEYPGNCLVDNCLIERTGRVEKQTAGVQISMSAYITIRHCSIYEVPRAGINISEGTFGGHLIEFCDVFDTVLETGDHGSFNSWGRDRFWELMDAPEDELPQLAKLDMLAENTIRNSRWRCDHGWDIDLDDGSSNYRVYNNLLLAGGLKFREGFNRVAENNIMVNNSFHPHVWYRNSGDIVRHNIVFTDYRPIRVPVPWGHEVDRNLLHQAGETQSRIADTLAKDSGRDEQSLVADALFVNPEIGDFRVKEKSPALALGFSNFPMDQFGVRSPELKKIARTPEIPSLQSSSPDASVGGELKIRMEHIWEGATVRDLEGEEFSSFGVSKDSGGVHFANVPENSEAAQAGVKENDVLQKVNDQSVKSVAEFFNARNHLAGQQMRVTIVRAQQELVIEVPRYSYVVTSQFNNPSELQLNVATEPAIPLTILTARPQTSNQPLSILKDGKLSRDYGPVFGNGIRSGIYKVSLGQTSSLKSISTITFNQNGNRGPQRFIVFGTTSETDPGWNFRDQQIFKPICEVDTTHEKSGTFQSTAIHSSDQDLGEYRWLLWVVYPVSPLEENSAFQEFTVTSK